ncbi:sugar transport system permease [Paenibacillus mucilaginosus 3016]|uniref:Sugar transport system permease n=1 Tax=Paenibacillus mucilaginosus 3016 TaxID=1116391 RepID=H6NG36_9BACL|nr:sugar ABC transporter permease [Paenibacillus mucilaginosus]AFC31455.1 sugar transport system permease [Paenibacillus mucilaginosus 3016]
MNAKPLTASGARTAKKKSLYASEKWWGYLFVAPPFIGLTVFLLYPLLTSLYYSFTIFDFSSPPQFVGTENYKRALFEDPLVWKTLWNTFYAALGVPIGMAVSLLIAILLNQNLKGKNLFRMLFFLPTICSIVAMTLIWQWIFNSDYGLLNYFLSLVGIEGPAWLTDETWAMPAMIFQGVWGGLGISIIMYLAALSNVPTSLYEAATMDGAGGWKKFVHITVPGISPITFFILVTSLIAAPPGLPALRAHDGRGPELLDDDDCVLSLYYGIRI